jgi:hypothetical protein
MAMKRSASSSAKCAGRVAPDTNLRRTPTTTESQYSGQVHTFTVIVAAATPAALAAKPRHPLMSLEIAARVVETTSRIRLAFAAWDSLGGGFDSSLGVAILLLRGAEKRALATAATASCKAACGPGLQSLIFHLRPRPPIPLRQRRQCAGR